MGLAKDKSNKANPTPETLAHDGIALAASHFIKWQDWVSNNARGGNWIGKVQMIRCPFAVITRPQMYRRQLHFDNPVKGSPNHSEHRKRKGGTITPFGFRSGDKVKAEKAGKTSIGWIGGYVEKQNKVSVYSINWPRIGQFSVSKVQLIKRSTRLLSYVKVC